MSALPLKGLALANQLYESGRLVEAAAICNELLKQSATPDPTVLHLLGVIAYASGNFIGTAELLRRAIAIAPSDPMLHNTLGLALMMQGRHAEAVDSSRRCLSLLPEYVEGHYNLACAMVGASQFAQAIAVLSRALAMRPDYADAHQQMGIALMEAGRGDLAMVSVDRALALKPDDALSLATRALILQRSGRIDEAIAAYRLALQKQPASKPNVLLNLGGALHASGQIEQAIDAYRLAIAADPDFADAHWNLSLMLLTAGRFAEGWQEYEWRLRCRRLTGEPLVFDRPQWTSLDEDVSRKTILVHCEQGFGDVIQFARYLPMVAARGAKVIVRAPAELARLLKDIPGIEQLVPVGQPAPAFDLHTPIVSLPCVFRTTLETIPHAVPYITAQPRNIPPTSSFRVGLVWAGRPTHPDDANRSINPRMMAAALANLSHVQFYSLQKADPAVHRASVIAGMPMIDLTPQMNDFADTASLLACLDLLITVDTSVAHLAGAMGKPVWLMLPWAADWRWMRDRDDSPWYPTMRLLRQRRRGDWDDPLRRVTEALGQMVRQRFGVETGASPEALHAHGVAAAQAKRFDEAIAAFRQALALRPVYPETLNHLGLALLESDHSDEAVTVLRRATAMQPSYADAHHSLGLALHRTGQINQAITSLRHAITFNPNFMRAHAMLADVLLANNRPAEAIVHYQRAAASPEADDAGDLARVLNNLGVAAQRVGRHDLALGAFQGATDHRPEDPDMHWNLAWGLLSSGQFERGWKEFEWRLRLQRLDLRRTFSQPQWTGQDIAGQTILLFTEGGLGDAIQFIRYAPMVAERGATVILQCQPTLVSLLSRVRGISKVIPNDHPLLEFDWQVPLQSLPLAFDTRAETIPAAVPYLSPSAERISFWREQLTDDHAFKVGLSWAGSPLPVDLRSRSLSQFAPLAGVEGVRFYSLQKGAEASETPPAGLRLFNPAPADADMDDTAALIANLDLVISVDTSVAHLAGALGKPVWTLVPFVPDFRWMFDRDDSPWYPTMRLFRQTRSDDWGEVFDRIADQLTQRFRL